MVHHYESFDNKMDYLAIVLTALYWIAFPFIYILSTIFSAFLVLLSPSIHLGHFIAYACWYPFQFVPNFETLYIFVGVALIVGALTGLTLHFASSSMTFVLGLDHPFEEPRGRTLESYRADQQEKRDKKNPLDKLIRESHETQINLSPVKDEMLDWDWVKRESDRGRSNGMIPNTILEEDDSSGAGY